MNANQVLSRCDSTNAVARALIQQGASSGTWISARVQEKGKGRQEHHWVSPEGNLYLSLIWKVSNATHLTWLPLVVACTVHRQLCALNGTLKKKVKIKWPNDLVVADQKLGGILCEGIQNLQSRSCFVIIGIGLNYLVAPVVSDRSTTSVLSLLKGMVSPKELESSLDSFRFSLIKALMEALSFLEVKGPDSFRRYYNRFRWAKPRQRISWKKGSTLESGEIWKLGKNAELWIKKASGEKNQLWTEEVSTVKREY